MSSEDKSTPNKELNLKDIEKHLERQDEQAKRETFFAIGTFGTSVALVGITLWVTNPVPSPIDIAMSALLIGWGLVMVTLARLRSRKTRN